MSAVQAEERGHNHNRQDHDGRLDDDADEIIQRALEVGPYRRRQHNAQRQQHDETGDRREQNSAHILPFPPPALLRAPAEAEHTPVVRAAKVWRGPAALGTLASVFAALPLADEAPLSATAIYARVAAWSPHCIRRCLRNLVDAGAAEASVAPATHPVTAPANLYRRAATPSIAL